MGIAHKKEVLDVAFKAAILHTEQIMGEKVGLNPHMVENPRSSCMGDGCNTCECTKGCAMVMETFERICEESRVKYMD